MILSLATVALVGGAHQAPTPAEASAPATAEAVVVRVNADRFSAVNRTGGPALLVVATGSHPVSVSTLPAGESVEWPVPVGATDGALLEVVQLGPETSLTSGLVSIDPSLAGAGLTLVFGRDRTTTFAWRRGSDARTAVGSSTPYSVVGAFGGCSCATLGALLHVPATTPLESAGPPLPPRLDDEPLPPI